AGVLKSATKQAPPKALSSTPATSPLSPSLGRVIPPKVLSVKGGCGRNSLKRVLGSKMLSVKGGCGTGDESAFGFACFVALSSPVPIRTVG
ncbi:MAG: hypothetical protein IJM89_07985, partial [Bacteroidales bacterium]|nr:hypothetical protein [Bacteroidales bacterium]